MWNQGVGSRGDVDNKVSASEHMYCSKVEVPQINSVNRKSTNKVQVQGPGNITNPEMGVTEIILAKSQDFVSCRVIVVGFLLGYRFLNS